MAQQTAVEWLINELESEAITDYSFAQAHKLITLDVYTFNKLIEQAKQMEKEQIQKAFSDGQETPINHPTLPHYSREEYYNERYKP